MIKLPEPGSTAIALQRQLDANRHAEQPLRSTTSNHTAPVPSALAEYAVQSVHHEYLQCRAIAGGELQGDPVNVAMPAELRRSYFHDKTIWDTPYKYFAAQQRNAQGRLETIEPRYLLPSDGDENFHGSVIYCVPAATRVKADNANDPDVLCQWREVGPRSWGHLPLRMKVTSATSFADNRWRLELAEVFYKKEGTYSDRPNGRTGSGYNIRESINSDAGVQGNGVNVDNLPAGVDIQPIPVGAVVVAWPVINCETDQVEYEVAQTNLPDGPCEGGSS